MARLTSVFRKEEIRKPDSHPKRITKWIHYSKLKRNEKQYCDADRTEIEALADLIEASGEVLQDLLVRKTDTDEYEIIAGHKRQLACKLLVEERDRKEFELLPCIVKNISDVIAEFNVYSSNGHHEKTPYEIMHELEGMEYLIRTYPEEFPNLQTGRMVERLAKQCHLKRATVGEYQSISKNLVDEAMEEFKEGNLDKSAAVTLSRMTEDEQKEIVGQGILKDTEIKKYRQKHLEPDEEQIKASFQMLKIGRHDEVMETRKDLVRDLKEKYGKPGYIEKKGEMLITCTGRHIEICGRKITWERYKNLLDQCCPMKPTKPETGHGPELPETDGQQEKGRGSGNEGRKVAEVLTPNINTVENWYGSGIEGQKLQHGARSRKCYMESLTVEGMALYINRSLSSTTLKSPEDMVQWLESLVDKQGNRI